jgi:hypothetical protein
LSISHQVQQPVRLSINLQHPHKTITNGEPTYREKKSDASLIRYNLTWSEKASKALCPLVIIVALIKTDFAIFCGNISIAYDIQTPPMSWPTNITYTEKNHYIHLYLKV